MFLIIILCFLCSKVQTVNYDEDINVVLPGQFIYHSPSYVQDQQYIGIFNNCICQESPGVFVYCYGDNCKQFPILSIDVLLFKLQLTSIVVIKRNDFRLLGNLQGLEIEGNKILKTIEPGCFKHLNMLNNLTITNNYMLEYLEENVFEGLVNLTVLSLAKNGFKRVIDATKGLTTYHVPSLRLLDLSQNIVHSIEQHEFLNMTGTNLTELNLYLCGMSYIHPNSLQVFTNLFTLRIGQNMCNKTVLTNLVANTIKFATQLDLLNLLSSGFRKTIPFELLKALGQAKLLTDIVLARNHFDEITDESFPTMPSLKLMDLRECNIYSISDNAFKPLTNMTVLLLNYNRLNTIPQGVLMPYLDLLDLGANSENENYFFVPDRIFENMTNLTNLQLCYNNIQYITKNTFYGLYNLTKLNLKSTQLNYIENGAFIHLKKLVHLNLNKNPLLVLNSEIFQGLSSLHSLILANCRIKNLTAKPRLLHYLTNLTYLDLYNNEIQTISSNQLNHLWNLRILHLENNKLTAWITSILPRNNYSEINLSNNKLTYLSAAMLEDFQHAKMLLLDGNPFRCDCSLYPTVIWLDKYGQTMRATYNNKTFIAKCDSPENWRKISFVEYMIYVRDSKLCEGNFGLYQIISLIFSVVLLIILCVLLYVCRWHIKYWVFLVRLHVIKNWVANKPQEIPTYQYDAFVSYSIDDKLWIQQLCQNLEPELKLCIFERDFPVGSTISQAVLSAVSSSKRTILIVSESFAQSSWCRWETQIAQFNQIFFRGDNSAGPDDTLVLVKLESVKNATPILRYLLKTRIYLEWPKDKIGQVRFWERLKYTLLLPKV